MTSIPRYLLVDEEVLVFVLDVEFPLHLLDLGPLQEDLLFNCKHFLPGQLALTHQSNQLPGVFQFFPESPQFIGTLGISTTSLANLANFPPTEADIWVRVIGILTGFELRERISA